MTEVSRRAFMNFAAHATLLAACSRKERAASVSPSGTPPEEARTDSGPVRGATHLVTMTFDTAETAAILIPAWGAPDARYPVLVALHGRGEALKGPERGAFGWPRDYDLVHAIERVRSPPITDDDLQGFVDPAHRDAMNAALAARPFEGLIVACPYVPDMDLRTFRDMRAYGQWIVDAFLPRVRRETPAIASAEATGIDGVSLGGATALRVGLAHPEAFGAVGALQPAVFEDQAQEWTEIARAARAKRRDLPLRLVTSHDDFYNRAITRLSSAWRSGGIAHDFVDVPGPHDYAFNRGPGAYELLLWHDRVLREKA